MSFSNSDVAMMRLFLSFLRGCFAIEDAELTFNLNVYTGNGLSLSEIERHWLDELDLPETCLRKHVVDHRTPTTTGLKKGKLPYGVGNLRVARSTWLVQQIYGAIQEYGGFEEPRWLG